MTKLIRHLHFSATLVVWIILIRHGFSWWESGLLILFFEISFLGLFKTRWEE